VDVDAATRPSTGASAAGKHDELCISEFLLCEASSF
jgi:hypothetical protein